MANALVKRPNTMVFSQEANPLTMPVNDIAILQHQIDLLLKRVETLEAQLMALQAKEE